MVSTDFLVSFKTVNIPKPFLYTTVFSVTFVTVCTVTLLISTGLSVVSSYFQRTYTTVFTVCLLFLRTSPSVSSTPNGPTQRSSPFVYYSYGLPDGFPPFVDYFYGLPDGFPPFVDYFYGLLRLFLLLPTVLHNGLHRLFTISTDFPTVFHRLLTISTDFSVCSRRFSTSCLLQQFFTHVVFLLLFKILFSARISYFFALIFLHTSATLLALVFTHFSALKSSSFTAKIFFYYSQFYPLLALKSSSFSR